VLITSLIGGLQMFDVPQILTNGRGNPTDSLTTVIMLLNRYLTSKDVGRGGALSVFLFVVTGILSLVVFRINSTKDKD
jgi:multiple sugar transport system permease protein